MPTLNAFHQALLDQRWHVVLYEPAVHVEVEPQHLIRAHLSSLHHQVEELDTRGGQLS